MKTIPMKVETKMMAFTDTTSNGQVIAFRATVLKSGRGGDCIFQCQPGIFILNHLVDPIKNFLAEWENLDYNVGDHFDGTYFTVPENGLYSFNVFCTQASHNWGSVYLYLNERQHIEAKRAAYRSYCGFVSINTTLKLAKNDKIHVRFEQNLYDTNYDLSTYFEGILVTRLDE